MAVFAGRHYRLEGNANYYEPLNLYCTTGCRARGTQITPHTEYDKISESYFNENEALLSDRTCPMREWLAKNVCAVLRSAGVLHLTSGLNHNTPVSADTIEKAVAIGRYFRNHARYAYSVMDGDDTVKKAEYVLAKLRCYQSQVVKRREVFRDCRGKYFKAVDDLKPTLNLPEEYGYLRQQSIHVDGTNRPSEIIPYQSIYQSVR